MASEKTNERDRGRVSAVLFAKDCAQLTEFYRRTLGLALTRSEPDYAILSRAGFDLVVHQIPRHVAASITIGQPPQRRERAALKLTFPVDDIASARSVAASLGGLLDPASAEWSDDGTTICMGNDPEGNVFQVSAA